MLFLKIFGLILKIGVIVLYSETGDISMAFVTYYHSAHGSLYGAGCKHSYIKFAFYHKK